jgi:hypothetical protein
MGKYTLHILHVRLERDHAGRKKLLSRFFSCGAPAAGNIV